MKNKLIYTIICILLLIIPSTTALNNITETCAGKSDSKPDLEIVDVRIEYDRNGWPRFFLCIKNSGTSSVPSETWGKNRLTIKELFRNKTVYSETGEYWSGHQPHAPGAIIENIIGSIDATSLRTIFLYHIFFEIDSNNNVHESNENNNIVWAYVFGFWIWSMPPKVIICGLRLGRLRH
jgi:hypothetical protein